MIQNMGAPKNSTLKFDHVTNGEQGRNLPGRKRVLPSALGLDTRNFEQKRYGHARIGAKVKVSDKLTGQFEYEALGGKANLRILWGEWNFGAGSLGIGQQYTPPPFFFPIPTRQIALTGSTRGTTIGHVAVTAGYHT